MLEDENTSVVIFKVANDRRSDGRWVFRGLEFAFHLRHPMHVIQPYNLPTSLHQPQAPSFIKLPVKPSKLVMSPSSSALPLQTKPRSRQSSNATPVPGQEPSKIAGKPSSTPQSPAFQPQSSSKPPNYTVFIRMPFTRGSFDDPPPVEWNATKDRQLWKLISGGKGDVNWEGLSHDFGVDLGFLVMQGAW